MQLTYIFSPLFLRNMSRQEICKFKNFKTIYYSMMSNIQMLIFFKAKSQIGKFQYEVAGAGNWWKI